MQRGQGKTHAQLSADMVQRILDENQQLILAVVENQQVHKPHECAGYLKRLQRNLMMLGTIGDAQVNSAAGQSRSSKQPSCLALLCVRISHDPSPLLLRRFRARSRPQTQRNSNCEQKYAQNRSIGGWPGLGVCVTSRQYLALRWLSALLLLTQACRLSC